MTRFRCRPVGVALAVAVLLLSASCGHMPVTSMVKLARIDFATVNPAGLRVAVKLPQSVRPRRGGVRLRITAKTGGGPAQVEDFVLRDLNDAGDLMALRAEVEPGTAIYAFRLDPEDFARVQSFRAGAVRRQASGGGGNLTLGVGAEACGVADLADKPIYLTTYLKTAPEGEYIPLMRDVDLRNRVPLRRAPMSRPSCHLAGDGWWRASARMPSGSASVAYIRPSSGILSSTPQALQCTASASCRCSPQLVDPWAQPRIRI